MASPLILFAHVSYLRFGYCAAIRHHHTSAQAQQLLLELQAGILRDSGLKDKQRARICTALAEADKCLVDGSDEFLQLLNVASVAQLSIQGTA